MEERGTASSTQNMTAITREMSAAVANLTGQASVLRADVARFFTAVKAEGTA